eukprot:11521145-Ditylum_brightwellii.AAC.1
MMHSGKTVEINNSDAKGHLQDMEAIPKESCKRSMSVSSSIEMSTNCHMEQDLVLLNVARFG